MRISIVAVGTKMPRWVTEGIAEYAANPVKKRPDYPEMPPQAHLDEETRRAAAEFMLKVTN